MITAEETSRRRSGLANVRISGQTVRRRLLESGLRARRPVIGQILKQSHRTARLTWALARSRRWRLHTWQHILFSYESRFSLRFCDGRFRVYYNAWGTFYGPVCVRVRPLWMRKWYGLGWNLSWWSHSAQNCSRDIECHKIQRRYSWSYRSALSATAKILSRLSTQECKMSRDSYLLRFSEPESHPASSLAGIIPGFVTNTGVRS